jgi:hypothetical protein
MNLLYNKKKKPKHTTKEYYYKFGNKYLFFGHYSKAGSMVSDFSGKTFKYVKYCWSN